jgi:nuclear GTP-binding protein
VTNTIPNSHPLKEEMLNELAAQKIAALEEAERLKEARKAGTATVADDAVVGKVPDVPLGKPAHVLMIERTNRIEKFANSFLSRRGKTDSRFERRRQSVTCVCDSTTPDRSYFSEFNALVDESDVFLYVLDARDPLASRSIEMERQLLENHPERQIIYVLNKIDCVPAENVTEWLRYLRRFRPTIAVSARAAKQAKSVTNQSALLLLFVVCCAFHV